MKSLLKKAIILMSFMFFLSNPVSANYFYFNKESIRSQDKKTVVACFKHRGSKMGGLEKKGLGDVLLESLSRKLLENRKFLIYNDVFRHIPDPIEFEKNNFDIYNHKMKDIYSIRQDIINRSIVNSFNDAFKKTPLGKKIKNFGDRLSRYFIIEYSKGDSDDKGHFYFPGKLSVKKMNEEKEYKISLSPSIYQKPNSLKEDFSLGIRSNFRGTKINTFYGLHKKIFGLDIESKELNSYLGVDIAFYLKRSNDEKNAGFFMSIDID